jgi:hypothetical protein
MLGGCAGGSSSSGGAHEGKGGAAGHVGSSRTGSSQGSSGSHFRSSQHAVGRAPRLTFIRIADQVCRRAHVKLARLGHQLYGWALATSRKRVSLSDYYSRAAALTATIASVAASAVADLRALPRPGDRRVMSYLTLSGTQARLLAAEADALRHHDARGLRQLNGGIRALGVRSRALAHAYGFHVCGGS